jgi:hypothetical protein
MYFPEFIHLISPDNDISGGNLILLGINLGSYTLRIFLPETCKIKIELTLILEVKFSRGCLSGR